MKFLKILYWIFFALWCLSIIAWIISICVPSLRKNYLYMWMLIPVWEFQIFMLIAKIG